MTYLNISKYNVCEMVQRNKMWWLFLSAFFLFACSNSIGTQEEDGPLLQTQKTPSTFSSMVSSSTLAKGSSSSSKEEYSSSPPSIGLSSSSLTQDDFTSNYLKQFSTVGMLGGSLASGTSYFLDSAGQTFGKTFYDSSFIQIIARKNNQIAVNFSAPGYSTKSWLESDTWGLARAKKSKYKCEVYLLLFGGNDIKHYGGLDSLGTIADVFIGNESKNPSTYYGNYSKIIACLKKIAGENVPIIALTYSYNFNSNALIFDYNQATRDVVGLYNNVYLVDLENDPVLLGPEISAEKYKNHFSPQGYALIADRIEILINETMKGKQ